MRVSARADREREPYQRACDQQADRRRAAHEADKAYRHERGLVSLMMPGRPR